MRIALHTCCGPCLLEPFDALVEDAERITVVFFNPNIHPAEEYERRREVLEAYARDEGIEVVELEYDAERWEREVGVYGSDRAARCRACYALRLGEVARWAAENGYRALATTLTVSPYQDAAAIAEQGLAAGERDGVEYLARDFRERYAEATARSRALGMFRQNYCGCRFSRIEAEQERERRREQRRRG